MNAFIQVSRLTRPQRLLRRPILIRLPLTATPNLHAYRPLSTSSPSCRDRAAPTQYRKGGSSYTYDPDEAIGSEATVHLRKGDKLDWEVAVQMAEERKRRDAEEGREGPSRRRNPNLPSLSGGRRTPIAVMSEPVPAAAQPAVAASGLGASTSKASQPEVATAQTSTIDSVQPEAEPSRLPAKSPKPRTRKGKEKAVGPAEFEASVESSTLEVTETRRDTAQSGLRRNPVGVQLLSPSLHRQLFPSSSQPAPPQSIIDLSLSHLSAHGLSPSGAAVLPEISFDMPPLQGSDLREHFQSLGTSTAEPYLSMARELASAELPPIPDNWVLDRPGWTKYHADGRTEQVQDLGGERMVSFDVETLYKVSPYPVMATAASPTAWYSWLSPSIFATAPTEPDEERPPWDRRIPDHHPHDLIPLFPQPRSEPSGSSKEGPARLVIGHNVGYDRARVLDEYSLKCTGTRWLDTLSLHVATHGITSVQRPAWQAHRKNKMQKREREAEALAVMRDTAEEEGDVTLLAQLDAYAGDLALDDIGDEGGNGASAAAAEASQKRWEDITSINSLAEVASLHCGHKVDKSVRNRFADDSISHASQLVPELSSLLAYCAKDVKVTHDVYQKVFPLFQTSCPHPATISGVLSMGNAFLPVDENWEKYLQAAETKYREMDEGVRKALRVLVEKLRKEGRREGDVFMDQLDWTEKKARWSEEVGERAMREMLGDEYQEMPSAQNALGVEGGPAALPVADVSTGAAESSQQPPVTDPTSVAPNQATTLPAWQNPLADSGYINTPKAARTLLPLLLRLSYLSHPVVHLAEHGWCFRVPENLHHELVNTHGDAVHPGPKDALVSASGIEEEHAFFRIDKDTKRVKLTGPTMGKYVKDGRLTAGSVKGQEVLQRLMKSGTGLDEGDVKVLVGELERDRGTIWAKQLDWSVPKSSLPATSPIISLLTSEDDISRSPKSSPKSRSTGETWPKWYWDLTAPESRLPAGQLDLTTKKTVAPLLLRLEWKGYPLCYSREHKWLYRVPIDDPSLPAHGGAVVFSVFGQLNKGKGNGNGKSQTDTDHDAAFRDDNAHRYFRLPHKDGEGHNVGNPLSKSFVRAIETGELASAAAADGQEDAVARKAAADATNMNVLCSYWISSRERIMGQMVVYDEQLKGSMASPASDVGEGKKLGMILPQVITMGTVTRRAVEATWLTASNAKKNRVGSELKAMVRAPPGYALVGADVDSEELWISSIMGDSQFGMHGASAIGWMTLEGTKSAGTDLHSKTANILGISRDAAKVFNYSRIYGAGQKHAVQLLLQGDPSLSKEDATKRAEELYKQTKGSKANRNRKLPSANTPSLWHGGSESYLFNTLEAIAHAERPTTPALGCGVTRALTKGYLESESSFLPSRINWVVQSSGVDYLHLLIVSMEYLIKTYDIDARYLISVHDEVRYLSKDEDRYRTALALQIANAWTRALFCANLGMDDMPQGVAFFSAVDVDKVLRKEVFMGCETPSHPTKIPEGESLGIEEVLKITAGSLGPVVHPLPESVVSDVDNASGIEHVPPLGTANKSSGLYSNITSPSHRLFLEAQSNEGGAAARNWLDRQPATESDAQAMVRNVRREVRSFGKGKARDQGAAAERVKERVKGAMKASKEAMAQAAQQAGGDVGQV